MSKKCLLPAKRAFEIRFLPQLCRGKKHFYPSKCAGWRQSRQDVRAAGMFRRKSHFSDFFAGLRLLLLTGVCLFLLCLGSHQPYHYSLLSVESVLRLFKNLLRGHGTNNNEKIHNIFCFLKISHKSIFML